MADWLFSSNHAKSVTDPTNETLHVINADLLEIISVYYLVASKRCIYQQVASPILRDCMCLLATSDSFSRYSQN